MTRNRKPPSRGEASSRLRRLVENYQSHWQKGQFSDALNIAEKMVEQYPTMIEGWELKANAHGRLGQLKMAYVGMQQAVELSNSPSTAARLKLGQYATLSGNAREAISLLERVVDDQPDSIDSITWLSRAYHVVGDNQKALDINDSGLALNQHNEELLVWRSRILHQLKRSEEALEILRKLREIAPNRIGIHNHIADLAVRSGDYEQAETHFRSELELDPKNSAVYSNLLIASHYNPAYSAQDIFDQILDWERRFAPTKQSRHRRAETSRDPHKRLKIGLLSGGFRTHPVGQMILPALQQLHKESLELYFYSTSQIIDTVTLELQQVATSWNIVEGLSDEDLDSKIRHDEIDILIDLNGPGEGSRYLTLMYEPAPLIVKWVGMLINTSGLRCMDYLITDSVETPPDADALYTEKLIRLPDDYICYQVPSHAPDCNALPALINGYITFGCLNNPAKLSPKLLEEWAELLHKVPNSKLLLKGIQLERDSFQTRIFEKFMQHGISQDRLILEGPAQHREFLETYHRIDIALDTWPYSGGLTTCEALMMGVPVVTCMGPTFAGRHSATHLINAGLPELVTENWSDFHDRVFELVSDIPNLSLIRAALRRVLESSPVCDGERFSRHLSTALRAIWHRHCSEFSPAALTMDKSGLATFEDHQEKASSRQSDHHPQEKFNSRNHFTIIDNGCDFVSRTDILGLLKEGGFTVVVFDHDEIIGNQSYLSNYCSMEYYPGVSLGDGYPTSDRQGRDIATVSLDAIEGLPAIDLLVLDVHQDALLILNNAASAIRNTLAIQVKTYLSSKAQDQSRLSHLLSWAETHSFKPYHLKEISNQVEPNTHPIDCERLIEIVLVNATLEHSSFADDRYQKLKSLIEHIYPEKINTDNQDDFQGKNLIDPCLFSKSGDISITDLIEVSQKISNYRDQDLCLLVQQIDQALAQEPQNNLLFYLKSQALLSVADFPRKADTYSQNLLESRLKSCGWEKKKALYSYWLKKVRYTPEKSTSVSAIYISNHLKPEMLKSMSDLKEENGEDLEIIFVDNGCAQEPSFQISHLANIQVTLNGNSGAYIARNVGAIFASSDTIVFIDDDGLPEPGFIEAHIDIHKAHHPACARGVYKPINIENGNPSHYNLGAKIIQSPPTLEGNVSFNRDIFYEVEGWADYILFGHGGFDISYRLYQKGYDNNRQLYTPKAVLNHDYLRGKAHATEKKRKQLISAELLNALYPNIATTIQNLFKPDTKQENTSSGSGIAITFPQDVANYVKEIYSTADTILEYGSGGSTALASSMAGKQIFTVENDIAWAHEIEHKIEQSPESLSRPSIHKVYVGETGLWAKPKDDSHWREFHKYPLTVWDRDDFSHPDVILIDGRFRVACFITAFLKIQKPTIVLFDDYKDRSYYHDIEKIASPTCFIGRMARFDLKPSELSKDKLTWALSCFNRVSYSTN